MFHARSMETELRVRIRQQKVVTELDRQALEEENPNWPMHDTATFAERLDNDYCNVLELLSTDDDNGAEITADPLLETTPIDD